ncbi:MAG: MurR/RpiR family transcriptional regulator [Lactobacillus panisapium]
MVIEWLTKQDNFTLTEKRIAQFFLEEDSSWQKTSARQLAQQFYVSPSTLTRFAQKAGFTGFLSFKEALLKEKRLALVHLNVINPNLPFEFGDSKEAIAIKLQKLEVAAISETKELLDEKNLSRVSSLINKYETICVYSLGDLGPVISFKNKLMKIGKNVVLATTSAQAHDYASFHYGDWLFLLVSYSGETPEIIRISRELKSSGASAIAMTATGDNSLACLSTTSLNIATGEKLKNNLGSFSTSISEMYLFDLLYSYYFTSKFIKNYKHKLQTAAKFEKYRKSDNPLLKD